MPKRKHPPRTPEEDRNTFISTARELGCSEDEAEFDAKLRKVTQAKPVTNPELKRKPSKRGSHE